MSVEKTIKRRIYGEDTDFLREVRWHSDLPSRTGSTRIGIQDRDITVHVFMVAVDGLGTREIQGIMNVEVKTRGGLPDESQRDTLWKLDCYRGRKRRHNQTILHFGAFILRLSGTAAFNSEWIEWGRFMGTEFPSYVRIEPAELWEIFRMERHPRNLQRHAFRRHHQTREIAIQTVAPLGFPEFRRITQRS